MSIQQLCIFYGISVGSLSAFTSEGVIPFHSVSFLSFTMMGNICVTCAKEIASKGIVQFVNSVSCSLPIHIGCILNSISKYI